jgi:hypothetical protein
MREEKSFFANQSPKGGKIAGFKIHHLEESMSKFAIVTDSTSYIPAEYTGKHNLSVVPLTLIWGDETFLDGVDIQPAEFYSRLKTAKVMPSTSQPSLPRCRMYFKGWSIKAWMFWVFSFRPNFQGRFNLPFRQRI